MKDLAILAVALATSALTPTAANAQDATVSATETRAQAAQPGASDIIVTAQRRATSLEKTPATISVIGEAVLSDRGGTVELQQIATTVPSLTITDGYAGLVGVSLRGVGTASSNQLFEQTIGLFIDGVYNPKPIQYRAALMDLERIEVIKGGQGVLFGESTSVGGISIITKKPTEVFEGYGEARYEPRYKAWETSGVVNVPLSDTLSARFAGVYSDGGGYVKNVFENQREPDEERWSLRGSLRFQPSSNFDIVLKVEASDVHTNGDGYQPKDDGITSQALLNATGYGTIGYTPYFSAQGSVACGTSCGQYVPGYVLNYSRNPAYPNTGSDITAQNVTLTMNYEFDGGVTLTSASGFQHFKYESVSDADLSPAPILNQFFQENFRQFSQEFRLASPSTDDLTWLVGVSALTQSDDFGVGLDFQNFAVLPFGFVNGLSLNRLDTSSKSFAGFAQLNYKLTAGLSVTAGARLTHKTRTGRFNKTANDFGDPTSLINIFFPATPAQLEGRIKDTALDLSASLNYQVSTSLLLYAAFAKGEKASAFNNANLFGFPYPDPFIVRPQVSYNYEIGAKYRSPDGRLYLAASAYYIDIHDFQDSFFNAATLGFVVGNTNAKSRGFELEGRFRLSENFSLAGSYGFNKAELQGGAPMQRAPRHTVSATADVDFPISASGTKVYVRPSIQYVSSMYLQDVSAAGGNKTNGRFNLDTRLGIQMSNGIDLFVMGENLTNSRDFRFSYGNIIGLGTIAVYNQPRTFTFGVRVPFGK